MNSGVLEEVCFESLMGAVHWESITSGYLLCGKRADGPLFRGFFFQASRRPTTHNLRNVIPRRRCPMGRAGVCLFIAPYSSCLGDVG